MSPQCRGSNYPLLQAGVESPLSLGVCTNTLSAELIDVHNGVLLDISVLFFVVPTQLTE